MWILSLVLKSIMWWSLKYIYSRQWPRKVQWCNYAMCGLPFKENKLMTVSQWAGKSILRGPLISTAQLVRACNYFDNLPEMDKSGPPKPTYKLAITYELSLAWWGMLIEMIESTLSMWNMTCNCQRTANFTLGSYRAINYTLFTPCLWMIVRGGSKKSYFVQWSLKSSWDMSKLENPRLGHRKHLLIWEDQFLHQGIKRNYSSNHLLRTVKFCGEFTSQLHSTTPDLAWAYTQAPAGRPPSSSIPLVSGVLVARLARLPQE